MGVPAVIFNGQEFFQPGSYTKLDLSKLNRGSTAARNLILIGQAEGGIPYNATDLNESERFNVFRSIKEAKDILKSGPLYDMIKIAFSPSKDPAVLPPNQIIGVVANQLTQSEYTLQKSTDDKLVVKSSIYGKAANNIKIALLDGSNSGKMYKVMDDSVELIGDDQERILFNIIYKGAGSAAVMNITNTKLTTTIIGTTGEDLDLTLADYENLGDLVNAINANPVYEANLVETGEYLKHEVLDNVSSVDIKYVVTTNESVDVTANFQNLIDWFNNTGKVQVTISVGATYEVPDNTSGYVYLSGATNTSAVTQDWTDALALSENITASYIGVATGSEVVHALLSTHLNKMASTTGRDERQGCIGGLKTLTKAQKIEAAKNTANMLMGYVADSIWQFNDSGELTEYDPFYAAGIILGMSAGNDVTFSPTFKNVNTEKLKENHRNDADDYIKAGCIIFGENPTGGFRVVRAVTTHSGSNQIANAWQALGTALFVTKSHRLALEVLIGKVGLDANTVRRYAILYLNQYVSAGWLQIDPEIGNAFRDVEVLVDGGTFEVKYEGTIPVETTFIFTTHSFVVLGYKGI